MSEEKCQNCGKLSEYPVDWYYDDREGNGVKYKCPFCGWEMA
jgi:predicted RNA-binding Zn-ribbon protein involved in translation (DUF1610 family)